MRLNKFLNEQPQPQQALIDPKTGKPVVIDPSTGKPVVQQQGAVVQSPTTPVQQPAAVAPVQGQQQQPVQINPQVQAKAQELYNKGDFKGAYDLLNPKQQVKEATEEVEFTLSNLTDKMSYKHLTDILHEYNVWFHPAATEEKIRGLVRRAFWLGLHEMQKRQLKEYNK